MYTKWQPEWMALVNKEVQTMLELQDEEGTLQECKGKTL